MFRIEEGVLAVLSWIHCVLLSAVVCLFAACLPVMEREKASVFVLQSLWMLLPIAASWFGVRKIRGFPLYLLAGLGASGMLLLLSRNLLCTALAVFVFLMRSYPRIARGKMLEEYPGEIKEIEIWEIPTFLDYPRPLQWLVFVAVYFAIIVSKRHELLSQMFYLLLAEIFITYIFSSVVRMKEFVTSNRRIANLPVKTMQLMQRSVLCVTLFLLLLFVFPSIIYGNEPLTFLSELEFETTAPVQSEPMQMASDMGGMQEMLEMIGEQEVFEWPEWVKWLMNVILYLFCAGGVIVIAMLLYQALRRMIQNFSDGQGEDVIVLLGEDETEALTGIKKKKRGMRARTPGMKIRREYKKLLKKNMKTKPLGWETPTDLERNAGIVCDADLAEYTAENRKAAEMHETFHFLYEKARYGAEECTREELEEFMLLYRQYLSTLLLRYVRK